MVSCATIIIIFYLFAESNTQSLNTVCVLPEHPKHGKWIYASDPSLKPGDRIRITATILFTCEANFKLYPKDASPRKMCRGGDSWGKIPKCKKICPSLNSNANMNISCQNNGKNITCYEPYEGATAVVKCISYQYGKMQQQECKDHVWVPEAQCMSECGRKSVQATPLIVGGKFTERTEYPWQVGVFNNYLEPICSGSIISTKLILSVANCFDRQNSPNEFRVSAGKLHNDYNNTDDLKYAQFSRVSQLIYHKDWDDTAQSTFANDICIVVVESPFKFNKFVQPICLDFSHAFVDEGLIDKEGIVTGWGYTDQYNGELSKTLKELSVDFYNKESCTPNLPDTFRTYYAPYVPDKLCAGYVNQNKSICLGDGGAPLIFRGEEDRYYLRGMASLSPRSGNKLCDSMTLSLYTSVRYHIDLILENFIKYQ